jgi:putative molybdopterin biosynthesis protein
MSVYLHDIPLDEARARLEHALDEADLLRVLGTETISLDENALGRVLAEPLWARLSSPNYHAAAMDGFALQAEAAAGAQPTSPVVVRVANRSLAAGPQTALYVDTGDPLPSWADAVVPLENVESLDEGGVAVQDVRNPAAIRIRAAVVPWTHVRPLGEDIVATQFVLPAGRVLRPADLGAAAAAGHDTLIVARKPRVGIVPTGNELVPIGSKLSPGNILEYNSLVLAAQVISMGGVATRYPITADDPDLICRAIEHAARENDLVLLNAGSSAGSEDFSSEAIRRLGTMLVHGIAVRPGHPVILGMMTREPGSVPDAPKIADPHARDRRPPTAGSKGALPIIGVPGYPVSAALTMEMFVEPLLARWLGRPPAKQPTALAELTRKVTSPAGDQDYVRVAVAQVGDRLLASPLSRGAGVITSLVQADGILIVPPGIQGIEAGEKVPVRLYRGIAELEGTIFCIGSHDLTLDLLAQFLAQYDRRLISANVGSLGGLIALQRRYGHLAGSHLLDMQTGDYNVSYVRQYMPGIPVKIVTLVGREQGLMVRSGNPKKLTGLDDLGRPGVVFINRQRGAGTRVLLDYHLSLLGISPETIHGYNQEEYTHLAVAAAVAGGRADCALGIAAAARALELEFVPLFRERYDLIIPREHAQSELLAPLLKLLDQEEFRRAVSRLPGYDTSVMGTVVLEDE